MREITKKIKFSINENQSLKKNHNFHQIFNHKNEDYVNTFNFRLYKLIHKNMIE